MEFYTLAPCRLCGSVAGGYLLRYLLTFKLVYQMLHNAMQHMHHWCNSIMELEPDRDSQEVNRELLVQDFL